MPRRAPIDPQGYYHVSSKGCYGRPLFQSDAEHELYLRLYTKYASRFGWMTLAWTLLWNHYHFVVRLVDGGLSQGMERINHGFSRRINAAYACPGEGHLVRHGFFARELTTLDDLTGVCRYVDLNAVVAGRCAQPEQWTWSGYAAAVGLAHARPFHHVSELLALFGESPRRARRAYRSFVAEGLASPGHVPFPGNGKGASVTVP